MRKSQKAIVLEALQSGARLTSEVAMLNYNILRLASRVSELRKEGYDVRKRMIKSWRNRGMLEAGEILVAEYYLHTGD